MRPPILVTGCARSGTSLTAGILAHCGAFGGHVTGPMPHNPKGQFENGYIRDQVTKPYLASMGVDKLGQKPLPDVENLAAFDSLQEVVESTMRRDGYSGGPWYYKGAKICLVWPVWVKAFPEAEWIIVRRRPQEIAESCMRTRFMRAYKDIDGWLGWVREHEKRFEELKKAARNVQEFWPEEVLRGDVTAARGLTDSLGLPWHGPAVQSFITPEYWNGGVNSRVI